MSTISNSNSQFPLRNSFSGSYINAADKTMISVSCMSNVPGTITITQSYAGVDTHATTHTIDVPASIFIDNFSIISLKYVKVSWAVTSGTIDNSGWLQTKIYDSSSTIVSNFGSYNNAWNNELTGTSGNSNSVNCQYASNCTMFGHVDGATTISVWISQNNTNFYQTGYRYVATGDEDVWLNIKYIGAQYIRLQSSVDVTANITLAGKF